MLRFTYIACVAFSLKQQAASLLRFISHTHTHTHTHTSGRTPPKELPDRIRVRCLCNSQQTQATNIGVLNGIQTRDSSNQATADLRIRQYGHRDRP
jgi:hypothetical protein